MDDTFRDWALVSLSPLSATHRWGLTVVVLAAAVFVLWTYRGMRRPWLLMGLRIAGAVLVLGFILEPALQVRMVRRVKSRLAVILDRSLSMSLEDGQGQSRYAAMSALINDSQSQLEGLANDHALEWFDLENPITPAVLQTPPGGQTTGLLEAIESTIRHGGGRALAGVVMLTDGADNGDLAESKKIPDRAKEIEERVEALSVPVNVLNVSEGAQFRDLAIAGVTSDDFAFLHNTIEIEARISATGFGGMSVPVTLRREGEVLATQEIALQEGSDNRVTFELRPDRIGKFIYSITLPAVSGDAVPQNNARAFAMQVIRDKVRVLQVAGRPSWDERFLRQHLKENPNVDLISFFILRTHFDDPRSPDKELSLIPFPWQKLFTTELKTFDVVVFQNFDYVPYNMGAVLPNLRQAVEEGLGFAMLGGEMSFGPAYRQSPLQDILPLRAGDGGVRDGGIRPQLTEAGEQHPIMDLTRGAESRQALWNKLPQWTSANLTDITAEGTIVLAQDPRFRNQRGEVQPLVAVREVGQGRVMAIATDSMWRWRFSRHRDGGAAERAYHRFWSNALRWLVQDPEHTRVRVRASQRRVDVGDKVEMSFSVLSKDYRPLPFATVRATLLRDDGSAERVDEIPTGETGLGRLVYQGLAQGAYRVRANAQASGEAVGSGEAVFVVETISLETRLAAPRPELLEMLAAGSGGQILPPVPDSFANLETVDPEIVEVARRRNIDLWDNAWALLIGIALLAADWAARRSRGYL